LDRRDLVKSAIAVAGAAMSGRESEAMAPPALEFYQLRKYTLRTGPQLMLTQSYFEHALIPALNRIGIAAVGAFKLDIGPETPSYYLLIPAPSAEILTSLDTRLREDAEYSQAAAPFLQAPAAAPAFVRVESSLLSAFAGWPKLVAPKGPKRIFQLRTYESAGFAGHMRKVQMFDEAEIGIFVRTGLAPVFFGDTVIGPRMPSLTYMLTFADVNDLNEKWKLFGSDPAWKQLSQRPENADAEIVSNISNLYLSPLSSSQI
jgi:hypothetical protein